MTLRGRWGAMLAVLLVMAATVALFYYFHQLRKDSLVTLQNKLQSMEKQYLEEEKGKQAGGTAEKVAVRFNQWVDDLQRQAEALAAQPALRRPALNAVQRKSKIAALKKYIRNVPAWNGYALTDAAGNVMARSENFSPRVQKNSPAFQAAATRGQASIQLAPGTGKNPDLILTVPVVGENDAFLGVLQTRATLAAAAQEKILLQTGVTSILGENNGRFLTPTPIKDFTNSMGVLADKSPGDMEKFLSNAKPYFRTAWSGTTFVVGLAATRVQGIWVYTPLELSGLEKLVETTGTSETFWDPVIVGGLVVILLAGLLLALLLGGGSNVPLRKLTRELQETLQNEGPELPALTISFGGGWRKLTETVNLLIDRMNQAPPAAGNVPRAGTEALKRLDGEIVELHQEREHLQAENQELRSQLDAANKQNASLRENTQGAVPAEPAAGMNAENLAEASRIRIEAIGNMSEDLKATLTVIKNYISSILSSEEGKISDAQQEFLGVVINKSARLERQINDLLDLSHLESETAHMFFNPTDLTAMLQDVILNAQPQADTKQIRLNLETPVNLPQIPANGDRLGQVFVNLVQHAIRNTPVGGEIRITLSQTPERVVIKLLDSGASLTEDQTHDFFQRFFSAEESTPGLSGSGLKFVIIKSIIDAHHGSIEISGLPGQGNEIAIQLPKAEVSARDRGQSEERGSETESEEHEKAEASEFDLSTFMHGHGEEETASPEEPRVAGGEDLDLLLRDIDKIDENLET